MEFTISFGLHSRATGLWEDPGPSCWGPLPPHTIHGLGLDQKDLVPPRAATGWLSCELLTHARVRLLRSCFKTIYIKLVSLYVNSFQNYNLVFGFSSVQFSRLFNLYAEYIMRNAGLEEVPAGIKIAGRNIDNLR